MRRRGVTSRDGTSVNNEWRMRDGSKGGINRQERAKVHGSSKKKGGVGKDGSRKKRFRK